MGVKTTVYKFNGDLAINIPRAVLPPATLQYVEEKTVVPGHPAEIREWIPLVLGAVQADGRIPMFLPPGLMGRLNLDITKKIKVRLYGEPTKWFTSHIWHRPLRDRVWIPRATARKLKLRPYTYWFAWLSGTTLPEIRIRQVPQMMRRVIINYFDKPYVADQIGGDRWRFIIPKEFECYPVLLQAYQMIPPVYPLAELHRVGDNIYLDFYFYPDRARMVSEQAGYAWRNMGVRSYTATATDVAYPFLCEIRVTYISSCPKRFYQIKETPVYTKADPALTLTQALGISVYNILQYAFPPSKRKGLSTMARADALGHIEYTTDKVELRRRYPRIRDAPPIISIGETSSAPWNIMEYPYYRAIKYIRIVGKFSASQGGYSTNVYLDDDVERLLGQIDQKRVMEGLPSRLYVDKCGFVWRTFADEE